MYMYMYMYMDMYIIQLVYSIMYIIYIRYQFNSSQFCHFWCDWSVKCRTMCFFELLRFGDFSVIFHHENQLKKKRHSQRPDNVRLGIFGSCSCKIQTAGELNQQSINIQLDDELSWFGGLTVINSH